MTAKKVTRRPGYEPAHGRPDPEEIARPVVDERQGTHLPGLEGPPCGLRPPPSDPAQYSHDEPTCPVCAKYQARAEAVTRRLVSGARRPPPPPAPPPPKAGA